MKNNLIRPIGSQSGLSPIEKSLEICVAANHKLTKELLKKFPKYEKIVTYEDYGTFYVYHRSNCEDFDLLRQCTANIDAKKGKHPAQIAYLHLQRAETALDTYIEYDERHFSDNEPDYFQQKRDAKQMFKDVQNYYFARRKSDFKWILRLKENINYKDLRFVVGYKENDWYVIDQETQAIITESGYVIDPECDTYCKDFILEVEIIKN